MNMRSDFPVVLRIEAGIEGEQHDMAVERRPRGMQRDLKAHAYDQTPYPLTGQATPPVGQIGLTC